MVLSPAESALLTAQVAELAQAGLPLAPGLRALGLELRRGRLARALGDMAARLEAGQPLLSAVEAQGRAFPAHLRGLLSAAAAQGHLAETMAEFVAHEQMRRDRWRQICLAAAYPALLLAGLLAVMMGMSWALRDFGRMLADFETTRPQSTLFVLWMIEYGVWCLAAAMGLAALSLALAMKLRRPLWPRRLAYHFPLFGPLWRWAGVEQFSRLMALFLGQNIPLPAALRYVAGALAAPDLAAACYRIATQIEAGTPLGECLARQRVFPRALVVLADWSQGTPAAMQSFQAAAEMFRRRVEIQISLVEAALPPCVFALIVLSVGGLATGLLMPLVALIRALC
jgi:type II secretory pathway component PulF